MQPLTQRGSREEAAHTATTATTKLTATSRSNCNGGSKHSNINNLTLTKMRSTTIATATTTRATTTNPEFHKRRRRRPRSQQSHQQSSSSSSTITTAAAAAIRRRIGSPYLGRTGTYLTLLLLTTTCSLCAVATASTAAATSGSDSAGASLSVAGAAPAANSAIVSGFVLPKSPCAPQHWWDPQRDKCTPCTSCQGEMIPLRPCQLHIDTVCGSIYDLKIDWVVLAKTEPNWKERRKSSEYEHFDHPMQLQHFTHAADLPLDWQTVALFIAVFACLLFFSVAACILIHHMRQWRRMERRLDQDVEELSTKLMAKLAEVQSLDGGTFFIGNADALRGMPASAMTAASAASAAASRAQSGIFQPQHVLLPVEKHAKHPERRILKALQPGNVYIEESNGIGAGVLAGFKG